MRAEEARKIAEQFTPDVKEVLEIVKKEATNGGLSTSGASRFLFNERVRKHLEKLGYRIKFVEAQRDGYWEISW